MDLLDRLRRPLPAPPAIDLALGVALAVWWLTEEGSLEGVAVAAAVLGTVPLGWRRGAPLAVAMTVGAGIALSGAPEQAAEPLASLVAMLIASFTAGAHLAIRPALVALVAVTAGGITGDALAGGGDGLFVAILAGAGWAAGRIVHRGQGETRQAREEAVAEERERIARELHDVVSHSVSLMVVHAGAAEQVLDTDPEAARRSLVTVRETGREAVDDLRRMLGLLRGDHVAADAAPQPGLDGLPALAEATRTAGTPVSLRLDGAPPLTGGTGLAAFRIVQEALTNTTRHAPGRPAEVVVEHEAGRLRLSVRTLGARNSSRVAEGTGHGLVGIRERAALYGGSAEAGWEDDDFVLRAELALR